MANVQAFESGWSEAGKPFAERRALKQQLSAWNLQEKHDELKNELAGAQARRAAAKEGSPEYQDAVYAETVLNHKLQELLDPTKGPGLGGKILNLGDILHLWKQRQPSQALAPARVAAAVQPGVAAAALPADWAGAGTGAAFPARAPYEVRGPAPAPTAAAAHKGAAKPSAAAPVPPTTTTTPQPLQAGAQAGLPTNLAAEPAYKKPELGGRAAYPGEFAKGSPRELKERAKRWQAAEQRTAEQIAGAAPPPPNEVAAYRRTLIEGGIPADVTESVVRHKFAPEVKETAERYFPQLQTTTDEKGIQHYWRVPMSPGDQPEEVDFQGQKIMPKVGKQSNVQEERDMYRASHGIAAGVPLTFVQEKDFVKQMSLARNPFGGARIGMEREALNLRESESGFKDFLAYQKQLSPLEKVIDTSTHADEYVANHSGPGDVALTLAFFDAIKTQGVRFTKQEQDFILGSRGIIEGAQAKIESGFTGEVLAPEQRKLIAGIIKKAADQARQQESVMAGGVARFRPDVAAAAGGGTAPSGAPGAARPGGGVGNAHKVGDFIMQGGHKFKVTSVDASGRVTGAEPAQ